MKTKIKVTVYVDSEAVKKAKIVRLQKSSDRNFSELVERLLIEYAK